ncbi:MAG TPA: hypothetical protein DHM44_03570 [Flexistipes sinusarabici]|uniref:Response regulatory domain-containing protein n=1 Tax=Flexistipes sinusarabici TaxID=2352 RepID=A0A3D5QA66_FLESI|nr:hypothetical protein [Flexistipes sinusarabici]
MKILLVDDEKHFKNIFSILSRKYKFQFECAENIKEAIRLIKLHNFDLAVIDYSLPDGNGTELNRFIKLNHPSLKTALSTGYTDMVENTANGDFDYYIRKDRIVLFMEKHLNN